MLVRRPHTRRTVASGAKSRRKEFVHPCLPSARHHFSSGWHALVAAEANRLVADAQLTAMAADTPCPRGRNAPDEILEKQNELIRLVKLFPLEEIDYHPRIRDYNILYDALVDTFGEECIGGSATYPYKLPCQINEYNVEERSNGLKFDAHLKIDDYIDDYVVFEFDTERMVTRCFVNPCCIPDHRPLLPVIDNILYRVLDRTVIQHVYCESERYIRDHIVEKFEERHYCW
uniref:DUF3885 domain-containing protein n=1 Tax=Steinernema glaseri TaxID=37863 RepID=A0A1I7ZFT1_9BILA